MEIKKVGGVVGTEGASRLLNAWRDGLSARDWGAVQRRRLERVQEKEAAPEVQPRAFLPKLLTLPVYTSLLRTRRDRTEVERLLARLDEIFSRARVQFELQDAKESVKTVELQPDCPFSAWLDHECELLHLAFVPFLPEEEPYHYACGRCCVLSDGCDDRGVAQAVGRLLGLPPVDNVCLTDRLMSRGSGLQLTSAECQWLRWNAASMLGEQPEIPLVRVPVCGYQVVSPPGLSTVRTEREGRQILEKVNAVWEQAGIEFELHSWGRLEESEFSADDWSAALKPDLGRLAGLIRHRPDALHCFFFNYPLRAVAVAPEHGLLLLPDRHQEGRTRPLAHGLGRLLGLPQLTGLDQLMTPLGEGFRLSPQEITVARTQARERPEPLAQAPIRLVPQVQVPAFDGLEVPVRLHLTDCPQDAEEGRRVVDEANRIWRKARIRLKLLSVGRVRATLDDDVRDLPGYDAAALNLYFAKTVANRAGDGTTECRELQAQRALWFAAEYCSYPAGLTLARSLASFFELEFTDEEPGTRLLSYASGGEQLSAEEGEQAREEAGKLLASMEKPAVLDGLPELTLPVRLHLARHPVYGSDKTLADVRQWAEGAQAIWDGAAVRLDLDWRETFLSDEVLDAALPPEEDEPRDYGPLRDLPEARPGALNVYLLEELQGLLSLTNWECRVILLTHDDDDMGREKCLAQALGKFMGLERQHYSVDHLMSRGPGAVLGTREVARARAGVLELL